MKRQKQRRFPSLILVALLIFSAASAILVIGIGSKLPEAAAIPPVNPSSPKFAIPYPTYQFGSWSGGGFSYWMDNPAAQMSDTQIQRELMATGSNIFPWFGYGRSNWCDNANTTSTNISNGAPGSGGLYTSSVEAKVVKYQQPFLTQVPLDDYGGCKNWAVDAKAQFPDLATFNQSGLATPAAVSYVRVDTLSFSKQIYNDLVNVKNNIGNAAMLQNWYGVYVSSIGADGGDYPKAGTGAPRNTGGPDSHGGYMYGQNSIWRFARSNICVNQYGSTSCNNLLATVSYVQSAASGAVITSVINNYGTGFNKFTNAEFFLGLTYAAYNFSATYGIGHPFIVAPSYGIDLAAANYPAPYNTTYIESLNLLRAVQIHSAADVENGGIPTSSTVTADKANCIGNAPYGNLGGMLVQSNNPHGASTNAMRNNIFYEAFCPAKSILEFGNADYSTASPYFGVLYGYGGLLNRMQNLGSDQQPKVIVTKTHASTNVTIIKSPSSNTMLAWFYTNKTSTETASATIPLPASENWLAISARDWSVIGTGTGSSAALSVTIPARGWNPVYIVIANPTDCAIDYTNAQVTSQSQCVFYMDGPHTSSSWMVVRMATPVVSVVSSRTGAIPLKTSLANLNTTCVGACWNGASWSNQTAGGYYLDVTNHLLYVQFLTGSPTQITVNGAGGGGGGGGGPNGVSVTQFRYGGTAGSGTSLSMSCTFLSPVATGDVIMVGTSSDLTFISTMTDNQGNAYSQQRTDGASSAALGKYSTVWTALSLGGSSVTVTATFGQFTEGAMGCIEVHGLSSPNAVIVAGNVGTYDASTHNLYVGGGDWYSGSLASTIVPTQGYFVFDSFAFSQCGGANFIDSGGAGNWRTVLNDQAPLVGYSVSAGHITSTLCQAAGNRFLTGEYPSWELSWAGGSTSGLTVGAGSSQILNVNSANWANSIAVFLPSSGIPPPPPPDTVSITVTSDPAGLTNALVVDNVPYTGPQTFNWVPGSSHNLTAVKLLNQGGLDYGFGYWNNPLNNLPQTATIMPGDVDLNNSTAATCITTQNIVAGDVIIVLISSSSAPLSVTDSLGNTFALRGQENNGVGVLGAAFMYSASSIAGADTVTSTFASPTIGRMNCIDASGISNVGTSHVQGGTVPFADTFSTSVSSFTPPQNSFVVVLDSPTFCTQSVAVTTNFSFDLGSGALSASDSGVACDGTGHFWQTAMNWFAIQGYSACLSPNPATSCSFATDWTQQHTPDANSASWGEVVVAFPGLTTQTSQKVPVGGSSGGGGSGNTNQSSFQACAFQNTVAGDVLAFSLATNNTVVSVSDSLGNAPVFRAYVDSGLYGRLEGNMSVYTALVVTGGAWENISAVLATATYSWDAECVSFRGASADPTTVSVGTGAVPGATTYFSSVPPFTPPKDSVVVDFAVTPGCGGGSQYYVADLGGGMSGGNGDGNALCDGTHHWNLGVWTGSIGNWYDWHNPTTLAGHTNQSYAPTDLYREWGAIGLAFPALNPPDRRFLITTPSEAATYTATFFNVVLASNATSLETGQGALLSSTTNHPVEVPGYINEIVNVANITVVAACGTGTFCPSGSPIVSNHVGSQDFLACITRNGPREPAHFDGINQQRCQGSVVNSTILAITWFSGGSNATFCAFYILIGGGSYNAPVLSYISSSSPLSLALSHELQCVVADGGSAWSVTNPLTGVSASAVERAQSNNATSGVIIVNTTSRFVYWHQYFVSFKWSVGNDSPVGNPNLFDRQFGLAVTTPLSHAPIAYWLDAGSSWHDTNPWFTNFHFFYPSIAGGLINTGGGPVINIIYSLRNAGECNDTTNLDPTELLKRGCVAGAVFFQWFQIFGPYFIAFLDFLPALAVYLRTENPGLATVVYLVINVVVIGAGIYGGFPATLGNLGPLLLGVLIGGSIFQLLRTGKGG